VGEVLVLAGVFARQHEQDQWPVLAVVGSTGIVLGAWYLLTMVRRVFFGPVKEPEHENHAPVGDLDLRELVTVVPVALLCLVLGVCPQPFLHTAKHDIEIVADIADRARERQAQQAQTRSVPVAPSSGQASRGRKPPGAGVQPGDLRPVAAQVRSPLVEGKVAGKGAIR
jgi:formate hydrogenlyase subunit 3/multisubunit Na+/H+ antiporter MnhD subunit